MHPPAERPLFLLISALASSEITAGNPEHSATFMEFGRVLEQHGFYTQEDVTAPTVFRLTMEDIMDKGLDPGLGARPLLPCTDAWRLARRLRVG